MYLQKLPNVGNFKNNICVNLTQGFSHSTVVSFLVKIDSCQQGLKTLKAFAMMTAVTVSITEMVILLK